MKTLSIALTFIGFLLFYNQSENKPETVDEPAAIGFVQTTKGKARLGKMFHEGIVVENFKEDKDDQYHIFFPGHNEVFAVEACDVDKKKLKGKVKVIKHTSSNSGEVEYSFVEKLN